jgi:hypothetical protein
MQKWNGTLLRKFDDVVDGNASVGTTIVVRNTVGNTIAVVYDVDDTNSVQKNNPFVTDDFGRYSFFAPNGKYTIEFGDGSDSIEIVLVDNIVHGGLLDLNAVGGHDSIYERKTTVAQIESGVFALDTRLTIEGRHGSSFIVETGTSYDGGETIYAGAMKVAKLQFDTTIHAAWVGAISNSAGVLETETTASLNLLFSYADKYTGINIELGGRYFTNDELVFPLVTDRSIYLIGLQTINGNNSIIVNSASTALNPMATLVIKTGASIGNRNYGLLIQDLLLINTGTYLTGSGLSVEGAFSPTIRRVYAGNYDVCFDNYCSSEVLFDKCVAFQCNIGIKGSQLSNPNGVNGNDFSVVTYNQFVCFGFESHGIYTEGGGASKHIGGTIAAPGLAARSAIFYIGSIRSVDIDGVLIEQQQALADGALVFVGAGLKRSIKISGVVQEVLNTAAPATLIRADNVENITIENVPFSVAGDTIDLVKYAVIDGAKQVNLTNNARTGSYLNKIDLYDVDNLVVDNMQMAGRNSDLNYRRSSGEPVNVRFDGTFSPTAVVDNNGKTAATCTQAMTLITATEFNRIIGQKIPIVGIAKVLTGGNNITAILKTGNVSKGQITSGCKTGRWKTHLFSISGDGITTTTDNSSGINFTGISAVSYIGFLTNDDIISSNLFTGQADITSGISGWPLYETIYNSSTSLTDPIGWVNTIGGVKVIPVGP